MEYASSNIGGHQNVIVMRHGDRLDNFEPLWRDTSTRPWDPPLAEEGMVRAFGTGQRIRSLSDFPIHRVFVSPFLRCVQTASEVVAALSALDFHPNAMSSKDVPSINNSKLKVAIEYGLGEILNTYAIWSEVAPKDGEFDFQISDFEAMFPKGMVDHNADMVYKEVWPKWGETAESSRDRYVNVVKALANKYPSENLLIVTHGGGVSATLYKYFKETKYTVDYCGCVELRRQSLSKDGFGKSVEYEVVTSHGVSFRDNNVLIHDPIKIQSHSPV